MEIASELLAGSSAAAVALPDVAIRVSLVLTVAEGTVAALLPVDVAQSVAYWAVARRTA